jgi:CRISPR-associated protein Csd2
MNRIPTEITDPAKRHEFVLLFDVTNGNPNGDPDAMNAPRIDPETSRGFVTDVALKRKVRDYLALTRDTPIFIQSEVALNTLKLKAAEKLTEPLSDDQRRSKKLIPQLRSRLCADYYDIRMFGAVLATGEGDDRLNAGQVRGPVQITFARSHDPILILDLAITRQARTTEQRMETGATEMGRKSVVPYGLYRAHGYFNPFLAERTGVTADDLVAFWEAVAHLFDLDRSASRPEMFVQGLYVFTHDSKLGNAPAHRLFERIAIERNNKSEPPRSFADYTVAVEDTDLPPGVQLTTLVA